MPKIEKIEEIPMEKLEIGKYQVRTSDVGKNIDELAESIDKVGLLEPIMVSKSNHDSYEIILGQRRFLACRELGKETIRAAIIEGPITEAEAKTLSVTENLIREDLNRKDVIDACTYLYNKYGTIKDVAEETGLSRHKVSDYVKYPRLIDELQDLVDEARVSLKTALRAQDAAGVGGEEPDPEEAVEFAKEMDPMSGAQQDKIVEDREDNPEKSAGEIIEDAKTGGSVTQINVTLTADVHKSLKEFAESEDENIGDAASELIEGALSDEGFLN